MPLPKPMTGEQQSLNDCLGRVDQAEKALFSALSEIVSTRQAILEMVQNGVEAKDPPVCNDLANLPPKEYTDASGCTPPPKIQKKEKLDTPVDDKPVRAISCHTVKTHEDERRVEDCALEAGKKLGLSREEILEAYELFCEYDIDQSGMLSLSEVHNLLTRLADTHSDLSHEESQRIFKSVDLNRDDMLDFSEFLMCMCHLPKHRKNYLDAAVTSKSCKMTRRFTLRMVGLPYATLHSFIEKELDEMGAFLSIPIIFLLFFCFVLSTTLHHESSTLHAFEDSFRVDIEDNANFGFSGVTPFENGREGFKNVYDIQAIEDFWSWMDLGLMPLFFPSGWSSSETRQNVDQYCTAPLDSMTSNGWNASLFNFNVTEYINQKAFYLDSNLCKMNSMNSLPEEFPPSLKSLEEYANAAKRPYRLFNEIIGGVRMKQEQLSLKECPRSDLKGSVYKTPCIEDNAKAWLRPSLDSVLAMEDALVDSTGGETIYFKSGTSLEDVKKSLQELENQRWFNPKTSKIQILLTAYNNHVDLFAAIYVNILVNRAGNIHKVVEPVCIWMSPYRHATAWVTDLTIIVLLLKLCIEEIIDMVRDIRKKGLKCGCRTYFDNMKNIIDWVTIVFSIVVVTLWILWCTKLSDFVDLLLTADADLIGSWPNKGDIFTPSNEEYWSDVDALVGYTTTCKYIFAFYPFAIGGRFFATFSAQPRLGLVTATLGTAAKDIFHFLVVLLVIMCIYCSSAEYLFSEHIAEFETFGRSFVSVFRAMIGEYDFTEIKEVGRWPAAIWYVGFMVLVHMIMLNMLLAIIMDVYARIKNGMSDDEETIWSQTYEIWERWQRQRRGEALPLKRVLKCLTRRADSFYTSTVVHGVTVEEPKLITVSAFIDAVPDLSEEQAEIVMSDAYDWWREKSEDGVKLLDIQEMLRLIDLKLERAQEVVNSIEGKQARQDTIDEALRERILRGPFTSIKHLSSNGNLAVC